jgi:hypothetical protein
VTGAGEKERGAPFVQLAAVATIARFAIRRTEVLPVPRSIRL